MKILFIHNIIAPYRTPLFETLSNEYDIQVIFLQKKDKNRKWSQNSNDLHFNNMFLNHKNYTLFNKNIIINSGLKQSFDDFNPDILVTIDNPQNFLTTIYSITIARKKKIPIILWTGAFDNYRTFQINKIKNEMILLAIKGIRKYIYSFPDYFWAYSKETKKHLMNQYAIDEKKIKTGLQGYPDELINFKEIDLRKRFNTNKILFIGSLEKRKGIDILLQVFNKLQGGINDYTLEIIGDGNLYQKLKNEYEDNPKINFFGFLDGHKKYLLINESKYLVLPSVSDPWGWVVNEATSCKLPSLVSESVMAKEVVDDDRLIFKTNSHDDLYNKLKDLMLLPYEEYEVLSKKVFQNSRNHTLDKAINSFKSILKTLK